MNESSKTRQGVILALAAYIMWGIAPIYFKIVSEVPAEEVLIHRIIWSFLLLALLLFFTKKLSNVRQLFKQPKSLMYLVVTSVLISINWLLFTWAVMSDRLLDASLGYYINPLFNVVLAMVFLGERFRRLQWLAVGLATIGVMVEIFAFGSLPWIALVLASTFGCYGLLRKKVNLDAMTGLFVETLMMVPVAAIYLLAFADSATSDMTANPMTLNLLLISAGWITTLPLLCFTSAATKIRLSTLGFFQYIGPSMMFVMAVSFFGEDFSADKATTFGFIWCALAIFIYDAIRQRQKPAPKPQEAC
ncbi:protein RarD [Veronia nyctiphanis]|uniref:Protein RarD n=1 Tax=Veronia nyctiphanis TaxID=1278244 RepID=A0A4Q0YP05_9GAMM|nr:EamA family transporter RarD [Veronia nyctiphanis]RXJ72636.1 protein RarD [Veronia nyctiphanis]